MFDSGIGEDSKSLPTARQTKPFARLPPIGNLDTGLSHSPGLTAAVRPVARAPAYKRTCCCTSMVLSMLLTVGSARRILPGLSPGQSWESEDCS